MKIIKNSNRGKTFVGDIVIKIGPDYMVVDTKGIVSRYNGTHRVIDRYDRQSLLNKALATLSSSAIVEIYNGTFGEEKEWFDVIISEAIKTYKAL